MAEPDYNFIARQNERILVELRAVRDELLTLPAIRDEIALLRGEFQLMRETVRILGVRLARIEDLLTHNVLERIQKLEEGQPS